VTLPYFLTEKVAGFSPRRVAEETGSLQKDWRASMSGMTDKDLYFFFYSTCFPKNYLAQV